MRVFVTGATGFIGSALVPELKAAGHQVLGMARSDEGAAKLAAQDVEVHRGELTDVDSIVAGAKACDGVIHLAYIHDFSKFMENAEIDRRVVTAVTQALEGTNKPLVVASGTLMMAHGRLGVETDPSANPDGPRSASDAIVLGAAERGVRGVTVRLSPSVHDKGAQGLVSYLIMKARETGVSAYVGEGANRWPAVHRSDAARLFRLALEKAAPGTRLHAVGEEGVPLKAIAEALGAGLGVPSKSLTPEEAGPYFDWMNMFIGADNPTSSKITRETMGWTPTGPGLLEGLRSGAYLGG